MTNRPIWPAGPLHSACNVPLSSNPGVLPNMSDTVSNLFQLLVFEKVVKTIVNFEVVETTVPVQFQGFIAIEPKRKLVQDAHGQRRWKTKVVYTWPTVQLSPDDVMLYEGQQYRVGATMDFKQYGFCGYELLEDYHGSGPEVVTP